MTDAYLQTGRQTLTTRRIVYPLVVLAAGIVLWWSTGSQRSADTSRIERLVRTCLVDVCEGRTIKDRLPSTHTAADEFILTSLQELCEAGIDTSSVVIQAHEKRGGPSGLYDVHIGGMPDMLQLSVRAVDTPSSFVVEGVERISPE